MAYRRVIPRDLFNEANLLKCYGRLWILLEGRPQCRAVLSEGNGEPFRIEQDQGDGSLTIANLPFTIGGRRFHLSRPLNSREAWPLYAVDARGDEGDEVAVFTDEGEFTPEFAALIA